MWTSYKYAPLVHFEGKDYSHACMRVPITNLGFADKRKRRRRKRDNSEPVTRNLSRSEIDAWSGDDDYYPDYEEYPLFSVSLLSLHSFKTFSTSLS